MTVIGGLIVVSRAAPDLIEELDTCRRLDPRAPVRGLLADADVVAPAGWRRVHLSAAVSGGDLAGAGRFLADWDVLRHLGIGIIADGPALEVGTTVVQRMPRRGPSVLAPCRVVEAVHQADEVGFTYAALAGHPFEGEEAFHVLRLADGRIECRITSISRPAAAIARRLGVVTRAVQTVAARRYLHGLLGAVGRA